MLLKYIQTPERDDIELVDRIQLTALTGIEEPEMKKKKTEKKTSALIDLTTLSTMITFRILCRMRGLTLMDGLQVPP